jgi:hypothetical protein
MSDLIIIKIPHVACTTDHACGRSAVKTIIPSTTVEIPEVKIQVVTAVTTVTDQTTTTIMNLFTMEILVTILSKSKYG